MARKAQITFYVILVVLFAIMVGFYIVINSVDNDKQEEMQDIVEFKGADAVRAFVESCVKETTLTGLLIMGMQGGYVNVPQEHFSSVFSNVPYYYYQGEDKSPTTLKLELQLADYVSGTVDDCIYNFNAFRERGYIIETGNRHAKATIGDDVVVELNYPVTVIKDVDRQTLNNFKYRANVRMKSLHDISQSILTKTFADPFSIDHSHLLELMKKYNLQIDSMVAENGVVIYAIDDPLSELWPDTNLVYMFATKLDTTQKAPQIMLEKDVFQAYVGEQFILAVPYYDGNDDDLTFSTNSSLVAITDNGVLAFTPDEEDKGVHKIRIDASDGIDTTSEIISIIVGGIQ